MPKPRRQRRLAVPRSLTIGGQVWRVRVARKVPSDGHDGKTNLGLCDYGTRTIWLARHLCGDKRGETFCHELAHALVGEYADEAERVAMEAVIEKLEAPLHALLVSGQLVAVPVEEVR